MKEILLLLALYASPKAPNHTHLAHSIVKYSAAFDVDPILVTQIMLTESKGDPNAFNKRTHDYGLMQINKHTAKAMHFNERCLKNWECNLKAGIRIISVLQQYKRYRPCMYNVGPNTRRKYNSCLTYERKLASIR